MAYCKYSNPNSQRGASLVEYVLLLSMVSLVTVGSLTVFGERVNKSFEDTGGSMTSMSGGDSDKGGGGNGGGNSTSPKNDPSASSYF